MVHCSTALLFAAALVVGAGAYSLVDNPIVADEVTYLDGSWTATSSGGPSSECEVSKAL
jgi:hypothetical protein